MIWLKAQDWLAFGVGQSPWLLHGPTVKPMQAPVIEALGHEPEV